MRSYLVTYVILITILVVTISSYFILTSHSAQAATPTKLSDEPDWETHFTSNQILGNNLVLTFYHDSQKPQPVWVEGISDYTLSASSAEPNQEVTLTVPLVEGEIPSFRLHVGPDSEIFEFGGPVAAALPDCDSIAPGGYLDCGETISGSCELDHSLTGCAGDGIVVGSGSIIIDCNNFFINGTGSGRGFYVYNMGNVTVKNCKINTFQYGFYFNRNIYGPGSCQDHLIISNDIRNNTNGAYMGECMYINITSNTFAENTNGVRVGGNSAGSTARNNTVESNTFEDNTYGILCDLGMGGAGYDNFFYNNYLDNTNNIYQCHNYWLPCNYFNTTYQSGTNILGGSYLGGNYWSDYTGLDNGQATVSGVPNVSGDGIGDTLVPYDASGQIVCEYATYGDWLPLVSVQQIVSNCGSSLNSPGEWRIDSNISQTGAGSCITISSDDVILDCTDLSLSGDGNGYGIDNSGGYDNITVKNCNVSSFNHGLYWSGGTDGLFSDNIIESNSHGIYLSASSNSNHIEYNTITGSTSNGILFSSSDYNNITNNTISDNTGNGINLTSDSNDNIIKDSTITNNNGYGISFSSSPNNLIYNNYFNNSNNAYDDSGTGNDWNITKTAGTNMIGGPNLGGNFWSDYLGSDNDVPPDGLGDSLTPYNSGGDITTGGDYLPLKKEETVIYSCDTTLNQPGLWSLGTNITQISSWCLTMGTDDIILDCYGRSITDTTPWSGYGVYADNKTNITIRNCHIKGFYSNVFLHFSNDSFLLNNKLESATRNIDLYKAYNNNVSNNIINNLARGGAENYGIYVFSSSNNNTFYNNTINNSYNGLYLDGVSNNTLTDNKIYNSSNYALSLDNAPYANLTGNSIHDTSGSNLFLDSWTDEGHIMYLDDTNTFDGKTIYYKFNEQDTVYDSSYTDVGFFGCAFCDNVTIKDIEMQSQSHSGIYLWEANNSVVENMTFNRSGLYNIYAKYSSNTVFRENEFIPSSTSSEGIRELYGKNLTIEGNTFIRGETRGDEAINSMRGRNINCTGNNITDWWYGVLFSNSTGIVKGNKVFGSGSTESGYGVFFAQASNNSIISDNNITNAYMYGIYIYSNSNNNTVINNTVTGSNFNGIYLRSGSSYNNVTNNTASNNEVGIKLETDTEYNTISSNTVSGNTDYPIYLRYAYRNNVTDHVLDDQILLSYSSNNTIKSNMVTGSSSRGIWLTHSSDNLIYDNYFSNSANALDDSATGNDWNITKTAGRNIIGGNYLGGNFWSDYTGSDTSIPKDGLGDTNLPYSSGITAGGDWHPLVVVPPTSTEFSTVYGSTNFSEVPDITNVTNMTLATEHGKIHFPEDYGVNANNEDYDTRIEIGEKFISVDTAALNPTFNHSVNMTIENVDCPSFIYYGDGVYTTAQNILDEGNKCDENSEPKCTNIQCVGNTVTFTTNHFTGFAAAAVGQITSCGVTLSVPGLWTVENTISYSGAGPCITVGADNIIIDCIDYGNKILESTVRQGVGINNTGYDNITIKNCFIQGSSAGIYLRDLDGVEMFNNDLSYHHDGMWLYNITNINITSNKIQNSQNHRGIWITTSSHINLTSNIVEWNNNGGIQIIDSNYTTIKNNSASHNVYNYGIYVSGSRYTNLISNNASSNDEYGISISGSPYTTLINNTGHTLGGSGISVSNSPYATLINNTANNNSYSITARYGFRIANSDNAVLTNNTANYNLDRGFYISGSNNAVLTNNTANYNGDSYDYGIELVLTNHSTLSGNTVKYNKDDGIKLRLSNNNTLINNIVMSNLDDGICISDSSNNTLISNTIRNNANRGIIIEDDIIYDTNSTENNITSNIISNPIGIVIDASGMENLIYNNFFNSSPLYTNAWDMLSTGNYWNTTYTCSAGPNIVGGPCMGGNYWSDYLGVDSGVGTSYPWNIEGDRIGDTQIPYNSSEYIPTGGDYLPLIINISELNISITEGIFEPFCCLSGTWYSGQDAVDQGCDPSPGSLDDRNCDTLAVMDGKHKHEINISFLDVSGSDLIMECNITISNGTTLTLQSNFGSLSGENATVTYFMENLTNDAIDRSKPWILESCGLRTMGLTIYLNDTLNVPILVHRNAWTGLITDGDTDKAVSCYGGISGPYFNNTVYCDWFGDKVFSQRMAGEVFTMEVNCHDNIDNDNDGDIDCADTDCQGIPYYNCPNSTAYFDVHPLTTTYPEYPYGMIGGMGIGGPGITSYSCGPDSDSTNICTGSFPIPNTGKTVYYYYTKNVSQTGTFKVRFDMGTCTTPTDLVSNYIKNVPDFGTKNDSYNYSQNSYTLAESESATGFYRTKETLPATRDIDHVMYVNFTSASINTYTFEVYGSYKNNDNRDSTPQFRVASSAPSNWNENDGNLWKVSSSVIQGTDTSDHSCNDDVDNDLDFDTSYDCGDTDCNGVQIGVTTGPGQAISCEYGIEVTCWDGFDNDGDDQVDCADPDCNGFVGAYLDGSGIPVKYNTGLTPVYCEKPNEGDNNYSSSPSSCADLFDNDADSNPYTEYFCTDNTTCRTRSIDCYDAYSCWGRSSTDSGTCPLFENLSCSDGFDNDYDAQLQGTSDNWLGIYTPDPDPFDNSGSDCDDYDCYGQGNLNCRTDETLDYTGTFNASRCWDNIDNDLDAYYWDGSNYVQNISTGFDCDDPDCIFVANPVNPEEVCMPSEFSNGSWAFCGNNKDDDQDGKIDWKDNRLDALNSASQFSDLTYSDCWGQYQSCAPAPYEENITYDSCADGIDNDYDEGEQGTAGTYPTPIADSKSDCSDSDCLGELATYSGTRCVSSGNENTPALCSDGVDNDGDSVADFGDSDCYGVTHPDGYVIASSETSYCTDTFDNDNDGKKDCADTECYTNPACIDTTWSSGSCSIVVPSYSSGQVGTAPIYYNNHARRIYVGENYTVRFYNTGTSFTKVSIQLGANTPSSDNFPYDTRDCTFNDNTGSFVWLPDTNTGNVGIIQRNTPGTPFVGFDVNITCTTPTTPQSDSSFPVQADYTAGGMDGGSSATLYTQLHENVPPIIDLIQAGGQSGSSITIKYGETITFRSNVTEQTISGYPDSGVCGCYYYLNNVPQTRTNYLCEVTSSAITQDYSSYEVKSSAQDGSYNTGSNWTDTFSINVKPVETTTNHKLPQAFYNSSSTTLDIGNFTFVTSTPEGFGDCNAYITNATDDIVWSQTVTKTGTNPITCSGTISLPSSISTNDGMYFVQVNVTDDDVDTVQSRAKIFYVCNSLTSSATGWTCAKADFDMDGYTEGINMTTFGVSQLCDTCPGVPNNGTDSDGDGIDDACDVGITCGSIITESVVFTDNLECVGDGIVVGADDIVIDCAGFNITDNNEIGSVGINISGRDNITLIDCLIGDFDQGILVFNSTNIMIDGINILNNTYGILFDNVSNSTINNSNTSHNQYGIYLDSSTNNTITDNIVFNSSSFGMYLTSSTNNTIANNTANNNNYGIIIESNSDYNTITNNTANDNVNDGIRLTDSDHNNITSNSVHNNTAGIFLVSSIYNTIISNIAYDNNGGILLNSASNHTTIINNTANGNINNGIQIASSHNTVINNTANSNVANGIIIQFSNYNNLTNNTANNNTDHGFHIYSVSHSTFTDNTANNNTDHGFYLQENSNNNTLNSNTIYYNGNRGIFLSGSNNNTLIYNTVNSNFRGIQISSSNYNNLTNNMINNNTDFGINIMSNSNYNTLTNNTANNNDFGIQIYFNSYNNNLINNTANGNSQYGIWLQVNATNNTLINNTVKDNQQYGIYLYSDSDNNTLTGNTVYNNTDYGIYIDGSDENTIYNNLFNNTRNAYDDSTTGNYWNTTYNCTSGPNIIGGDCIGGNFWFDYDGYDTNTDGIGDTGTIPYTEYGNITTGGDYLPLSYGKGLVPYGSGFPFWTNVTNPQIIELNAGESQNVTFWVNATGDLDTVYKFFAYAYLVDNESIRDETGKINITIIEPIPVPSIYIHLVTPNESANFTQNEFSQFTVNVTCGPETDCGEINVTLDPFSGGDGTLNDPYQITNCTDLQAMRDNTTAHYILTQNIDCTYDTQNPSGVLYNGGQGFEPVGNETSYPNNVFRGTFDGQNHTITGLYINRPSPSWYIGLFGYVGQWTGCTFGVDCGEIKNVGLIGVNITGGPANTGGLVGLNYGIVENTFSTGNVVTGHVMQPHVGGLVGQNYGTISNSYSSAYVYSSSSTSSSYTGGLVGFTGSYVGHGNITNCYATGNVSVNGDINAGGLTGNNYGAIITDSYATGNVSGGSGDNNVGGLVGINSGTITDSFATGGVSGGGGDDFAGSLIGDNHGTITGSYWNNHTGNPEASYFIDCSHYSGSESMCIAVPGCTWNESMLYCEGKLAGNENSTAIQDNESHFYYFTNEPMASWDPNIWQETPGGFPGLVTFELPPPKSIIPVGSGTPFWTNVTNPYSITLNINESQLITFWVNATGDVGNIYEFFAYANLTSDPPIGNQTDRINITITQPLPTEVNISMTEGVIEPLCCQMTGVWYSGQDAVDQGCDASAGSTYDRNCDTLTDMAGKHKHILNITAPNVTVVSPEMECNLTMSNGTVLTLASSDITVTYVMANLSQGAINRSRPWILESCVLSTLGFPVYENYTINVPIPVHENTWTGLVTDGDTDRAVSCYGGVGGKYFNNTVICDWFGDKVFSQRMAGEVFTMEVECHDESDDETDGDIDCADTDCQGIPYYNCPNSTGYFDTHPVISGDYPYGMIGGLEIGEVGITSSSCGSDSDSANICTGSFSIPGTGKTVYYYYTKNASQSGTFKVRFDMGQCVTPTDLVSNYMKDVPGFVSYGKYNYSQGSYTLSDDETAAGFYRTKETLTATRDIDHVMYVNFSGASISSYNFEVYGSYKNNDNRDTTPQFRVVSSAPTNWNENDPALWSGIVVVQGTQTSGHRCNDGWDNDLDFDASYDCADTDCDGVQVGITTGPGQPIYCEYGAEVTCWDGFDNDEDGLVDCDDPDCNGSVGAYYTAGVPVKYDTASTDVAYCEYASKYGQTGGTAGEGENNYSATQTTPPNSCVDRFDNDADNNAWTAYSCDGTYPDCRGKSIDCFDPYSCWGRSQTASSSLEVCPWREDQCSDGTDNDFDVDLQGGSSNWRGVYIPDPGYDNTGRDCDDYDCYGAQTAGNYICSALPNVITEWDGTNNATCWDGKDNDLDAWYWTGSGYAQNSSAGVDCYDPDCMFVANPSDPTEVCLPSEFRNGSWAFCGNSKDDDQDVKQDRMDNRYDSLNSATQFSDLTYSDCWGQYQSCAPAPYEENITYDSCADSIDNDYDDIGGLGLAGNYPGTSTRDCRDPDCVGELATYSGTFCVSTDNENTPELCSDGVDNDGDGVADFGDSDCYGVQHTDGFIINSLESECSDTFDNDNDGLADCADPNCYGIGSCISVSWSNGGCQTVPSYTGGQVGTAPIYYNNHARRIHIGTNYTIRFYNSGTSFTKVSIQMGENVGGNEFPYDTRDCTFYDNTGGFSWLPDPNTGKVGIIQRNTPGTPFVGFDVNITCTTPMTPQSDTSFPVLADYTSGGDGGSSTTISSQLHEDAIPVIDLIQVGGQTGSSVAIKYGDQLTFRSRVTEYGVSGVESGICGCHYQLDGVAQSRTGYQCAITTGSITRDYETGDLYEARSAPEDGSNNIGSNRTETFLVNVEPVETTSSHKLNRAFYNTGSYSTVDTEDFTFQAASNDVWSTTCTLIVEDENFSEIYRTGVTGTVSGGNELTCSNTFSLSTANINSDGMYFVRFNATETTDNDYVLSDRKVLYRCDNLASSGDNWTCAKADFDLDGYTEGIEFTTFGKTLVCDTCPGIINSGEDSDGDGIDDVCDAGEPTTLSIWDDTDTQPRYVDQDVDFFANYSNASGAVTGALCEISFGVGPYGPFTMAYDSQSGLYKYTRSFPVVGVYSWNVSCTKTDYQPQSDSDTVDIQVALTELGIWDETDTEDMYPGEEIRFWARYRTLQGSNIEGADCNISFGIEDYGPFEMNDYGSGVYYYERKFYSFGVYDWNVTCSKLYYENQTESSTVEVTEPLAEHLNIKLTLPGTYNEVSSRSPYYSASWLNKVVYALVFHRAEPVSSGTFVGYNEHSILLTIGLDDSEAFVVFTEGNDDSVIGNRQSLIQSLEFMTHTSPSFGFGLGLYHPIKVLFTPPEIDIQNDLFMEEGTHKIVVESQRVGTEKAVTVEED